MIIDGLIRVNCGEPVNDPFSKHEKNLIDAKLDIYYETEWSSVIMGIMQYKNPLVANAHALTALSAKVD